MALAMSPEALTRLGELARQRKAPSVAQTAACAILDRAGLKPYAVEPDRVDVHLHDTSGALEVLRARLARFGSDGGTGSGDGGAE